MDWNGGFPPYVPVAMRRRNAEQVVANLKKSGNTTEPVIIDGRKIAITFWGKAWCEHLENLSDYENRLPRGRTYVRNGSVIDLKIQPGEIHALVSGSSLYRVHIKIKPVQETHWHAIIQHCAGKITSLIELLQGKLSAGVMTILCDAEQGLFPKHTDIQLACSCPDWATMCKHIAAVLYGVGARLDQQPEALFVLRQADQNELISAASQASWTIADGTTDAIDHGELADLFGIHMDEADSSPSESTITPTLMKAVKKKTIKAKKLPDTNQSIVSNQELNTLVKKFLRV